MNHDSHISNNIGRQKKRYERIAMCWQSEWFFFRGRIKYRKFKIQHTSPGGCFNRRQLQNTAMPHTGCCLLSRWSTFCNRQVTCSHAPNWNFVCFNFASNWFSIKIKKNKKYVHNNDRLCAWILYRMCLCCCCCCFIRHIFRSEGNSIWKTNRFQWKVQFLSSQFFLFYFALAHPFVHLASEFERLVCVLAYKIYYLYMCTAYYLCVCVCTLARARARLSVFPWANNCDGWLVRLGGWRFFLSFLFYSWHHHHFTGDTFSRNAVSSLVTPIKSNHFLCDIRIALDRRQSVCVCVFVCIFIFDVFRVSALFSEARPRILLQNSPVVVSTDSWMYVLTFDIHSVFSHLLQHHTRGGKKWENLFSNLVFC